MLELFTQFFHHNHFIFKRRIFLTSLPRLFWHTTEWSHVLSCDNAQLDTFVLFLHFVNVTTGTLFKV